MGIKTMGARLTGALATAAVVAGLIGSGAEAAAPEAAPAYTSQPNILMSHGIGAAKFGQSATAAIGSLTTALGAPTKALAADPTGCKIDQVAKWPGLEAYFSNARFVGYAYSGNGSEGGVDPEAAHASAAVGLATTKGLAPGATLAEARKLYGGALRTSLEQGGAWFARAEGGKLSGFLDGAPPIAGSNKIATIEAGELGCAAAKP
jgi:hypothetical protein